MSRFSRLQSGPSRVWAPPQSPLRIEFSSALLREVRMAGSLVDAFGVLYGVRHGGTVNVVSTRGRAGLDPVGIFAARVRGEVFLTEEDLERFEKAEALLALVIAGETCGFFVRDAQGALETVRSYEEFPMQSTAAPVTAASQPLPVPRRLTLAGAWAWVLPLFLLPVPYFAMHRAAAPPKLALADDQGTLKISWSANAKGPLLIADGADVTTVDLHPGQTGVAYARKSGDVTVRLGSDQTRFLGPAPQPTETERLRTSIHDLETRIAALRRARSSNAARIAGLERRLQ